MKEEDIITDKIAGSLNQTDIIKQKKIDVGTQKKIFVGTTCGSYKGDLRLLFQSAKQDLVVYLEDKESKYKLEENDFFKRYRGSLTEGGRIYIPLVIFEMKHNSVTTHQVRQYNDLAKSIKLIFPFTLYNFVLLNTNTSGENCNRIYMRAKNFDKIIYKENLEIGNPQYKELVKEMEDIIEEHVDYLSKEEHFGLQDFLL